MDDLEAAAFLNLHHFLLEVLIAQRFAEAPEGLSLLADFSDTVMSRIENRATLPPGDSQEDEALIELKVRMLVIARRFFERTKDRCSELAQAQGAGRQIR